MLSLFTPSIFLTGFERSKSQGRVQDVPNISENQCAYEKPVDSPKELAEKSRDYFLQAYQKAQVSHNL